MVDTDESYGILDLIYIVTYSYGGESQLLSELCYGSLLCRWVRFYIIAYCNQVDHAAVFMGIAKLIVPIMTQVDIAAAEIIEFPPVDSFCCGDLFFV